MVGQLPEGRSSSAFRTDDCGDILIATGCAGFIGARVCELLLAAAGSWDATGIDSLNDAYDIRLKQWRLARLMNRAGFQFHQLDIAERIELARSALERLSFDAVINLAGRAAYATPSRTRGFTTRLTRSAR